MHCYTGSFIRLNKVKRRDRVMHITRLVHLKCLLFLFKFFFVILFCLWEKHLQNLVRAIAELFLVLNVQKTEDEQKFCSDTYKLKSRVDEFIQMTLNNWSF